MRKYISALVLTLVSAAALGQYIKNETIGTPEPEKKQVTKLQYGPLPYRTLQETVGETYLVLPIDSMFKKYGYRLQNAETGEKLTVDEGEGKLLKLTSIKNVSEDIKEGTFLDSAGLEYKMRTISGMFSNIAPVTDIDNSRKMYIGKTLWLNEDFFDTGEMYNVNKRHTVRGLRFERVLVTDVVASVNNSYPVAFLLKTNSGQEGFLFVNISGTNTQLDPEDSFSTCFFVQDPKITYKFTPQQWQKIKANKLEIGMPKDAAYLIYGNPRKINTTTTANTVTEQWVYGGSGVADWFLYFTNGKLTSISR